MRDVAVCNQTATCSATVGEITLASDGTITTVAALPAVHFHVRLTQPPTLACADTVEQQVAANGGQIGAVSVAAGSLVGGSEGFEIHVGQAELYPAED